MPSLHMFVLCALFRPIKTIRLIIREYRQRRVHRAIRRYMDIESNISEIIRS